MFSITTILGLVLAFLKAIPEIIQAVTKICDHLKKLDAEHNEKTANERLTIKKQATQDFIKSANSAVISGVSRESKSDSSTPKTEQLSEDKSTVSQ